MPAPIDIATSYLAVWNAPSDAERRKRLDDWSAEVRYRDPIMQADGRDALAAMIEGARARFPRHAFALHGAADGHGSFVRFSWTLAPPDGSPVAAGSDVVRLDGAGRIAEVIGFLDGGAAA